MAGLLEAGRKISRGGIRVYVYGVCSPTPGSTGKYHGHHRGAGVVEDAHLVDPEIPLLIE
jgi:hypothetical protein